MTGSATSPSPELLAEAVKKAALAWVACGGAAARPVWCVPVEGVLYTVIGPGEQPDPGLAACPTPRVSLRGDHGGVIVTYPVRVERVEPGGEKWAELMPVLTAKRLNLPGTDETEARWAAECAVYGLVPVEGSTVGAQDSP